MRLNLHLAGHEGEGKEKIVCNRQRVCLASVKMRQQGSRSEASRRWLQTLQVGTVGEIKDRL